MLLRRVLVLALLSICAAAAHAQGSAMSESAVKAAFLFKFPAFVEWPAGTFQRPDQPLVIGVMGDDDVATDLEQIAAGRSVVVCLVVVRRLPEIGSVSGVHILFVAHRRDARLKEITDAVTGPVLVVTEQPLGLRLGGVLNFVVDGGRVRFAASIPTADARHLQLSSRLLAVAQNVEGRAR